MVTLSNNHIAAKISDHGAELHSLIHNGFEYIWQADPKYWGRHAPILFPIVGKAHNTPLPQHGFARDTGFQLINSSDTEATFFLQSNEGTLKLYPYKFELYVKYTLSDNSLTITYTVHNTDDQDIYFQIGGHPALNWKLGKGYLKLTKNGNEVAEINIKHPNTSGYITENIEHIALSNGLLPIKNQTFDNGAIVLENNQCDTISILDENNKTHLTLTSNGAKLFGIWSPEHKNAPFLCLEPWLGRADSESYNGDFTNRPYTNHLKAGHQLQFEYTITI